MKRFNILITAAFISLMAFSGCNNDYNDYVKNVKATSFCKNSSYSLLTWDALEGADSYNIYQIGSSGSISKTAEIENNIMIISNGSYYTSYKYAVSANVGGEESYLSKKCSPSNTSMCSVVKSGSYYTITPDILSGVLKPYANTYYITASDSYSTSYSPNIYASTTSPTFTFSPGRTGPFYVMIRLNDEYYRVSESFYTY